MLKHLLDFVNYTVAWPWLKATGKPGLNLLKPLSLASAQGQNQAILTFAKSTKFTKLFKFINVIKFGWPRRANPG